MFELQVGGATLEIDKNGFILDPDQWDEDVAAALAKTEGVMILTDKHWKVVNYIRDYYLEFGIPPMVARVCKSTGIRRDEIYELFPSGPTKGACKMAGLPMPSGCTEA